MKPFQQQQRGRPEGSHMEPHITSNESNGARLSPLVTIAVTNKSLTYGPTTLNTKGH